MWCIRKTGFTGYSLAMQFFQLHCLVYPECSLPNTLHKKGFQKTGLHITLTGDPLTLVTRKNKAWLLGVEGKRQQINPPLPVRIQISVRNLLIELLPHNLWTQWNHALAGWCAGYADIDLSVSSSGASKFCIGRGDAFFRVDLDRRIARSPVSRVLKYSSTVLHFK